MKESKRLKHYFPLFLLLLSQGFTILWAQGINLGIPPTRNFSKNTYQAGTQNWDAAQDSRGVLYFANNEGLLQYDGSRWTCLPVANKTVTRSVAIDSKGRIFVGAQNEMGYFFPDQNGQLRYHSLVHLIAPDKRNFEDVWDIVVSGESVFFRTQQSVFQFTGEKMTMLQPGGNLTAMFLTPAGLLLQRNISEILLLENGAFRPFIQQPELNSELTAFMHWQGDTLLFTSLKSGLFCLVGQQLSGWQTPHDALLKQKRIYSAAMMPNGHIVLATSLDGMIELDQHRRIYRHLTKKNGLQNNNILHAFADRAGNLWLGLDSGIDCVLLPSPFTSMVPDADLEGTGYAAAVFENQLYLGVSNGVYRTAWKDYFNPEKQPFFEKISATDGQVWSLNRVGNELLLGHHEGSFRLTQNTTTRIGNEPGAWTFVPLNDELMIGGNYDGLTLYRKQGNSWAFEGKLEGLNESCRFVVKDEDGAVWVAHPYRGLFRVEAPESKNKPLKVEFFNAANGLPSDLNNLVFPVAGKAVFATEKGIYRFDQSSRTFLPDEDFNRLLGQNRRIEYLKEDDAGNIWYVSEKEVGRLDVSDFGIKKEVRKRVFPELYKKLVAGFEFIYPLNDSNVFFAAEQGFIHYNSAVDQHQDTLLQLVLSQVLAIHERDSLIFGGFNVKNGALSEQQYPDEIPVLTSDLNHLRFAFSATIFENPELVEYRFRLKGLSDTWSEWSPENVRNFTNLSPGKYQFAVQARMKDGRQSTIHYFEFRIRPPWYASAQAIALYVLAVIGLFAGFVVRQHRKFEFEKESLTEHHQRITARQQREVEQSKAALTDALKEKLEAEILFKNKELATATMHLVQKSETLRTVQENLKQILEKSTNPPVKTEVRKLLNFLDFDKKLDDDWEQFAVHFDQVHVDFLKRLRERHPQLSSTDYKLCAYLRMNLTTKEIAPLMNISVRGVEAIRYRLRKKLDLPNDANLVETIAML